MWSIKETSNIRHLVSGQVTVGASGPTQLTCVETTINHGLLLRTPISNSGVVFIGPVGVTVETGFGIDPGDSMELPIDNASDLYAIAATGPLSLEFMGL